MRIRDFIRPASLQEAREALKGLGNEGMVLAGGTALHFMQDETPVTAVDVSRLGLSYIREEEGGYRIGATTPIADIQRHRAPRWALHEICRRMATHQIRNVSTIGGNIARVFPWADLPVVLLAMGAEMAVEGDAGEERIGADAFFAEQPAKRFEGNGALLTWVKVPALAAHHGFGSVKVVRTSAAFSMATLAVKLELDGDGIASARVAAGAALPFPRRLPEVEAALAGKEAGEAAFAEAAKVAEGAAPWRGKEGMSAEYSAHLAGVALRDALDRAAQFARERI